ncbi:MAG: polyprenyl synthetase family protein, partial [Phycisphaerae bacterium]|nr:polyprenyl synthetase family protein [Phycisphaerae bacterium]
TESTSDMLGKTVGKDARANKLTYVSVHGIEEARRQASREVTLAVEALAEFGPEADILPDLARFAVERTR